MGCRTCRSGSPGDWLCEGPCHPDGLRCAVCLFSCGAPRHYRNLLPVSGREYRPVENASKKQTFLLQTGEFCFCFRDDLPDETERRGTGKYLCSVNSRTGNAVQLFKPLCRRGGYAEKPVSPGCQYVCGRAGLFPAGYCLGRTTGRFHQGKGKGTGSLCRLYTGKPDGFLPDILWRFLCGRPVYHRL